MGNEREREHKPKRKFKFKFKCNGIVITSNVMRAGFFYRGLFWFIVDCEFLKCILTYD